MLSENIRAIRKSKGLSQAELAVKLNVVRQTVSKWEQGLSVPDSELLVSLSEALETPAGVLLGETVEEPAADDLKAISEKLELINLQLAKRGESRRKALQAAFLAVGALAVAGLLAMLWLRSPYLGWDLSDPETAVLATLLHSFEWAFVRLAPLALVVAIVGTVLTRRKAA